MCHGSQRVSNTRDLGPRGTYEPWLKLRGLTTQRLREQGGSGSAAVALARSVRRAFGEPRLWDWATVGIAVKRRRLAGSGMLLPDRFPIEIWVSKRDNERRQRFTVAHELCHFLLRGSEQLVGSAVIEEFCETFASELLVPCSHLNALRTASGDLPSAQEIVEIANRFRVNFAPVILQLRQVRVSRPSFAIVARPDEEKRGLVIDRSAGAGTIGGLVAGQRLASVGTWGSAFDESTHVQLDGTADVESRFLLPSLPTSAGGEESSDFRPRSGFVSGKAIWSAFRLRNRRVIISATFVHVSQLKLSYPLGTIASSDFDEAQLL